jgi:hypothetical protein
LAPENDENDGGNGATQHNEEILASLWGDNKDRKKIGEGGGDDGEGDEPDFDMTRDDYVDDDDEPTAAGLAEADDDENIEASMDLDEDDEEIPEKKGGSSKTKKTKKTVAAPVTKPKRAAPKRSAAPTPSKRANKRSTA